MLNIDAILKNCITIPGKLTPKGINPLSLERPGFFVEFFVDVPNFTPVPKEKQFMSSIKFSYSHYFNSGYDLEHIKLYLIKSLKNKLVGDIREKLIEISKELQGFSDYSAFCKLNGLIAELE